MPYLWTIPHDLYQIPAVYVVAHDTVALVWEAPKKMGRESGK
jgi:hypothetical protein